MPRKYNMMLQPDDIEPAFDGFNVLGVFNLAACRHNGGYIGLVRVAESPIQPDNLKSGARYLYSPRMDFSGNEPALKIDSFMVGRDCRQEDPTGFYSFTEERDRSTTISYLSLIRSRDGKNIDYVSPEPTIMPSMEEEKYGVEDPRIVPMNGVFIVSTVGYSERGNITFFRETRDFEEFSKPWRITAEGKNTFPFPEKINGEYAMLTRTGHGHDQRIEIARSPDLVHWGGFDVLLETREGSFDSDGIGGGAPPIRTPRGWLEIYHGKRKGRPYQTKLSRYACGAALIDFDDEGNPGVQSRSKKPIFSSGRYDDTLLPDVAFVSGACLEDDGKNPRLRVFGGMDDENAFSSIIPLDRILASMH